MRISPDQRRRKRDGGFDAFGVVSAGLRRLRLKTAALNHSATSPDRVPHIVCRAELCKLRDEHSWPDGCIAA
jgi:hypothetical protein